MFSFRTRATPLGRLVLLACLQVMLSAAYITYFSRSFDYGPRLIVLHVCTIAAVGVVAAIAFGLVVRLAPSARLRRLISSAAGIAFAILTLLYAADLLSNRHWGHNVTYDLAARYLARPAVLVSYVPLVTDWFAVSAVVAFAVAGALCLGLSGVIADGLDALAQAEGRGRRGVRWRVLVGAGLLPAATGVGLALTVAPAARASLLQRDPLIGFFLDADSVNQFALSSFTSRLREEGLAVRSRYSANQAFQRRNIVIIVADSLRADHMPLYGYGRETTPFLQRLSQEGRLRQVQLALASCPESNCAISSVMASKTFGSMVRENFKLHELLRDQGYAVNFILSGDHDWLGLREFYGNELTVYFDGNTSHTYPPTDDRVLFEGLEHVPASSGTPALFYFHLMSTHALGVHLEAHARYMPAKRPSAERTFTTDDLPMFVNDYDNRVVQADAIIEQLFDALNKKGYLENALVIILADHGEGLGELPGPRGFGHGGWLYQQFLRIPFLIYDSADARYANLDFATHTDLAPTVVARLGLPIPSSWEGRSLLDPGLKPYSYHYMTGLPLYAVVHATDDTIYKYLRQSNREELFELRSDPTERRDLLASPDGAIAAHLRERLADALASAAQ